MFDIGASELLLIVVVAVVIIGPKDLPLALRAAGRWMAKIRRVSSHFRSGLDAMIREAELEEMEKQWRERNEAIMKAHPATEPDGTPSGQPAGPPSESVPESASAEAGAARTDAPGKTADGSQDQGH